MNPKADPTLAIPSVFNLRVVGGVPAVDGRTVRTGLLYRSGALDTLSGSDADRFAALGIRTIYDLRSEPEREARPDRVPPGAEYVVLDMIRGATQQAPGRIMASLQDPASANAAFGEGRGIAMFLSHYREFVALPSARDALGRVFAGMLDEQRRPALLHCMGGKDRTGWAVAALLLLLGVEKDVMMQDYLASNGHLEASFDGFMADFKARGGDPEVIAAFMWARAEYLESALDEMRSSFGTIERYFAEGLGLGGGGVKALRAAFLDGA